MTLRFLASATSVLILCGSTFAQEQVQPSGAKLEARPKQLILSVGTTTILRMSTKQPIRSVFNENESVVSVQPTSDPTAVAVRALAPGKTRVTLVGEDGKKEVKNFGK